MKSMEDVRRLIREHGWAVLVVGSSGDLRAAHVPYLLDPVHDAGGATEQLVIIGRTARADPVVLELLSGKRCCSSSRAPTGTSHPPGTARIHPC
jgi:predicted FMN-binding regulatory protein PaiB